MLPPSVPRRLPLLTILRLVQRKHVEHLVVSGTPLDGFSALAKL
jgi:hypothetical protein